MWGQGCLLARPIPKTSTVVLEVVLVSQARGPELSAGSCRKGEVGGLRGWLHVQACQRDTGPSGQVYCPNVVSAAEKRLFTSASMEECGRAL